MDKKEIKEIQNQIDELKKCLELLLKGLERKDSIEAQDLTRVRRSLSQIG